MNEGEVSGVLGLAGWPAVAEEAIIARDVLLAEHVGSRLHVCHVSTAGSVEIVRWAKARGIDVTAEVTPHHLLLTDELARGYDPVYKVNPPLRTAADVEALRAGPRRRHDRRRRHRPRPAPGRGQGLRVGGAAIGMTGLETALSVVQRPWSRPGCSTGPASPTGCRAPRRPSGGSPTTGRPIAVGEPAHLTLVDPAARWTVDPAAPVDRWAQHPVARHASCPAGWWRRSSRGRPTVLGRPTLDLDPGECADDH